MSAILINSGGGIHVEASEIVLAPASLDPTDCLCCGPPQPPPPGCTRCYYGEDPDTGLPIYGAPYKKDFAVQISGTTDQIRYKYEYDLDQYTYDPPNCGCRRLVIDYGYEIVVNGLSGFNGTYYGIDERPFPADSLSTDADCNANGTAFDPYTQPAAGGGCAETDPCDYECSKVVWMEDLPISGSITCTYFATEDCSDRPNISNAIVVNVALTGYARLLPGSRSLYYYNDGFTPVYTMVGTLYGQSSPEYGSRYYRVDIFNGRITGASDCVLPAPSPASPPGCPGGSISSLGNHDCFPFWRRIMRGYAATCDDNTYPNPFKEITQDACNLSNASVLPTAPRFECGDRPDGSISNSLSLSAFYSKLDLIWTDQ